MAERKNAGRICGSSADFCRLCGSGDSLLGERAGMQELIIVAFGEISDDEWEEEIAAEENRVRDRIASYEAGVPENAEVAAVNLGRGADWMVLAVYFGVAAIFIPEAHKKIRENIEEWARIYRELHALFSWIVEGRKVLYPDEYLFLKAIEVLSEQALDERIEFKGVTRIPENNPDRQGRESLVFSFSSGDTLRQVAVARGGDVLWTNAV